MNRVGWLDNYHCNEISTFLPLSLFLLRASVGSATSSNEDQENRNNKIIIIVTVNMTRKSQHTSFLSGLFDSGLLVVVCIILVLLTSVFSFLLLVEYEWCHVLFRNNTVSWQIYTFNIYFIKFNLFKLNFINLVLVYLPNWSR